MFHEIASSIDTMVALLLLVLLTPSVNNVGQGSSHCMADCNMGQHGPSLYEQYCCISSNKGKIIHLTKGSKKRSYSVHLQDLVLVHIR